MSFPKTVAPTKQAAGAATPKAPTANVWAATWTAVSSGTTATIPAAAIKLASPAAWRAEAGIPTAAAKLEAWNAVVENDGLANALLEATVGGFSQPDQRELLLPFVDKYFDSLADIWETRTNEIAQTLTLGLFPSLLGSPEILAKADSFIAGSTDVGAIRLIRELRDNVARSLRCQSVDMS